MSRIAIFANTLQHFSIWCVVQRQREGKRLGQGLRVVESDLTLDVPEIGSAESLGNAKLFGMRMACHIQPGAVVEARRLDHQRIGLPMPHRVAPPGRIRISRQLAPVQKNLAIMVSRIKQRHYRPGLNDPVQPGSENSQGTARKTAAHRIIASEIREMSLEKR